VGQDLAVLVQEGAGQLLAFANCELADLAGAFRFDHITLGREKRIKEKGENG